MKTTVSVRPADGTRLYRRLLGYVRPHWKVFLAALLGMAFTAATETGFVALMKPMMDGSFVERDPDVIKWTPVALLAIFLVRGAASFVADFGMGWIARKVIKALRDELFARLLRLPVRFFDATPSGGILSKLIYDVEQVATAATSAITVLVRDSLTVVGLLGWMFYIDWSLAIILLVGAPLIARVIQVINRRFRGYSRRIQLSMGDVTHIAQEAIEGQREVKTFGGQAYEWQRFSSANEHNRQLHMKLTRTNAASVPVIQMVAATASAGVIYYAIGMIDQLTVGTFVSFVAAMMMLHSPMKRLTQINAALQKGIAAADSVFSFIDAEGERDQGTHTFARARGEVVYDNVGFSYAQRSGRVLDGISFRIEPGQTVAFVGRSGSGKSTLVSLLPRFYDVESGSIRVDGVDLRDIRLDSLRDQVALVSQHITLFNDTIAHNIAYGRLEGATREQVVEAARAAHALEFIEQLPDGFDTLVGENGVLLSGGQRQRLAIARALLKDAPVLILDEATSALDTASERYIQSALEQLMRNRTTLVIAHRLSTIERADLIIVMERGRIIETGCHAELLERGGHYADLYNLQFHD